MSERKRDNVNWMAYWICRRIVNVNNTKKYMTRIGQYTGTSNASDSVQKMAITVARVEDNLYHSHYDTRCAPGKVYPPELPFRKSAHKRPELVVSLRRQRHLLSTLLDLVSEQVLLE